MISKFLDKTFYLDKEKEINGELLLEFINKHKSLCVRYQKLHDMYIGLHDILYQDSKPEFKPDNRLIFNYAKYIVDTFNGFFIGIPVKVTHINDGVSDSINMFRAYNSIDDVNAEISKMCSIYGHAFELLFLDNNAMVNSTAVDPRQCFVIRDNSITEDVMFGVRYQIKDEKISGSISDENYIRYFETNDDGELIFTEEEANQFHVVPIIEYIENEERQGAFENVESLINAYNKAMSEKANDVDYFADAYLKILGAKLKDEDLRMIKSNRIINLAGANTDKLIVEFMNKPNADETQENLINRLEKQIFALSMVANINDENFGTSSGIALKYKLLSMSNLAITKERKFQKSLYTRYRIMSNVANSKIKQDDLKDIEFKFTRNVPSNILEESQIGLNLKNLVSEETMLNNLSIIPDVKAELEKMKEESQPVITYDDMRSEDEQ